MGSGLPLTGATPRLDDELGRQPRASDVTEFDQPLSVVVERGLRSGDGEPDKRGRIVARDAGPLEVHLTEMKLRSQVVTIGSEPEPPGGLGRILVHGATLLVELANDALRGCAPVLRGPAVPGQRFDVVPWHAKAEFVHLPEMKLGRRVPLLGGLADPSDRLGGIRGVVVEQGAERELGHDLARGGSRASLIDGESHALVGLSRRCRVRDETSDQEEEDAIHSGHSHHTRWRPVVSMSTPVAMIVAAAVAMAAVVQPPVHAQASTRKPDVVYIPTPQPVVEAMLALAQVKAGDVVYDLGSGDGRIAITAAAKYGAEAVGIELDPAMIERATANAAAAGVADRVRFVNQDMFTANIGDATVVTLYLLQSLNERLRPKLVRELKSGTRIVSHVFNMGPEWPPAVTKVVDQSRIFLWSIHERSR